MANLAIKGHTTRGREVIELLEMLGGSNPFGYVNTNEFKYYRIECFDRILSWPINAIIDEDMLENPHLTNVFTLEEFFEKFPYKIGDKVDVSNVCCKILSMEWDKSDNEVHYTIENYQGTHTAEFLQPYKEETMEEVKVESFEILEDHCANEVKIEFDPSKFEMVKKDSGYYVVKKQPEYPKNYKDCCDILDVEPYSRSAGYKSDLITAFRNLLICRDAYWKIAGDWNPNWSRKSDIKYGICVDCNHTASCTRLTGNLILVFPNEEMRDTFYENFMNEIEQCKELL